MKKLFCCILIMSLLLVGCSSELPEGFVENDIKDINAQTIAQLSNKDYDAIASNFNEVMIEALPLEKMDESMSSIIDSLGNFQKIKSVRLSSETDESIGEFVVCVSTCQYDNHLITYIISFDKNNKICGLYIK